VPPAPAALSPGKGNGRQEKGPAASSWEQTQWKPTPTAATSVPTSSQTDDVMIARPKAPGAARGGRKTDHLARKAAPGEDLDRG
jgi:hypothetical protein